jgi:DNA-binding MarR family transcriptional regulator
MKAKLRDQEEVVTSLCSSLNKVSRHLRHLELPKGFTPERFRTLATIQMHGPISVTGLAEREELRPATVSRMVSSLESDGLIKRREAKDDKRSVLISTTPKGRQMYVRANQRYLQYLSEAITSLEPEQIELMGDLASLLEKLSGALER